MAKLSKDIIDDIAAQNAIQAIDDYKELQAFVKGEQRDPLLDLAAYRLNLLKSPRPNGERTEGEGADFQSGKPKQGEQSEPITKQTAEFKSSGVEGTKAHTIDNVVLPDLRKKGFKI